MTESSFTITLVGDVMLARLIDQLLPNHVNSAKDAHSAARFKSQNPSLSEENYTPSSPWGTALPLLRTSDLLLINLETSATTSNEAWPNKTYNYRMHPANLAPVLHAAHVDYASLANNHILDYSEEGLVETVWTLKGARVSFAGAGETTDEAFKPAVLWLPRRVQEYHSRHADGEALLPSRMGDSERNELDQGGYAVHVYSVSDHPAEWNTVPAFHFINYSSATRDRLRHLLVRGEGVGSESESASCTLKIISVHWGPNYTWRPAERIRSLARFLVDDCGVDIVHGHSSHHVQGVEVYRGKVIIYGCGDFVDDYAVRMSFRNDLGAVWRVIVREVEDSGRDGKKGLVLDRLEVFPTRIKEFRACMLDVDDKDHEWVEEKVKSLSRELGTVVREELGADGQVLIDIV